MERDVPVFSSGHLKLRKQKGSLFGEAIEVYMVWKMSDLCLRLLENLISGACVDLSGETRTQEEFRS